VKPGTGSKPVVYVSFYDTLRFANWLDNGQPVGAQGPLTTENGAYTITAAGIAANSITRNAGATVFLPSENEWYKAAYYNVFATSFPDYPANSNVPIVASAVTATPNRANYNYAAFGATCCVAGSPWSVVGAYTGSSSPNGTFDQGGNVSEWTEGILGTNRVGRGGNWRSAFPGNLGAAARDLTAPANSYDTGGFRVAMVPEPGTVLLLGVGVMGLAASRRRA
jgi:formylglycine-generating enzyme required for sulfatase activity